MGNVTGSIRAVYESSGFYRLQLDGDQRYFGLGKNKPSFPKGTIVTFNAEQNAKGYWDARNLEEVARAPEATVSSLAASLPTIKPQQTDWVTKDKIIQRQSCRNSSIDALNGMIACGAVVLPKTAAKAYSAYLGYVNELTDFFEKHNDEIVTGKKKEAVVEEPQTTEEAPAAKEVWD
jgi:hypothetical protein